MFLIVCCNCTVKIHYEHPLTSKSLNYTGEEHNKNSLLLPKAFHLTISFRDPLNNLFTANLFPPLQHHLVVRSPTCLVADWMESFKKSGWSKCGEDNLFITGFYRSNPPESSNDLISLLEQAKCCNSTPEFSGQKGKCTEGLWRSSLDLYVLTHIILFTSVLVRFVACMHAYTG